METSGCLKLGKRLGNFVLSLSYPLLILALLGECSCFLFSRTLCHGNFRCIGSSLPHERNPLQDSDLTGIPLQGCSVHGATRDLYNNTKDCDSTGLHPAFATTRRTPTGPPVYHYNAELLQGATASL
ncbi:hypothetical protein TNIN_174651 [Trichonephila inaurata madagascariensis]|uniref:Uncharacterized protein n=1 Tax=Trichonephila inaurata madagascariensis TaxID=2747483 RepID=A0A8X7C2F2_9ARAC|nr:hypothetical protein TNIN_174651 [Trichonephila inaurata madagascariensis]